MFNGNYSSYLEQKSARRELHLQSYMQQQKEINRKEDTINRFKASASRAKGMKRMMKALDKMEPIDAPVDYAPKISFKFGFVQQSGKIVLKVNSVNYVFGQKQIFKNVTFEIERGQKVALVAPNGVGKTTLFNIIAGIYDKQEGSVELGYNVKSALFEQDQLRALNPQKTVLEEVSNACGKKTESEIRACLGAFLFPGDDTKKKIKVLSGGERNRVAMVKVLLQDANFLMLDEPTNHLDIMSKEILLKSLQQYPATILFVSHDRDFVNQLATHIIELTPDGAYRYEGNYDSFVYQKEQAEKGKIDHKRSVQIVSNEKARDSKADFELKKSINRAEAKVDKLSKQIADLQLKIAALAFGSVEYNKTVHELISSRN